MIKQKLCLSVFSFCCALTIIDCETVFLLTLGGEGLYNNSYRDLISPEETPSAYYTEGSLNNVNIRFQVLSFDKDQPKS